MFPVSFRSLVLVCAFLWLFLFTGAIWEAYPFLAVSHPVGGDVLILEGWVPTYTLDQAATAFRNGHYRKLLIIRSFDVDNHSSKSIVKTLLRHGLPSEALEMVYHPAPRKDRTYHMALAARDWLAEHEAPVKAIDVVTLGPHARRSRLTFEKAFGNTTAVGVIALDDETYDPHHWWRTSEGVGETLGEAIKWVYARFFFFAFVGDVYDRP